jgi:hypothetical protein
VEKLYLDDFVLGRFAEWDALAQPMLGPAGIPESRWPRMKAEWMFEDMYPRGETWLLRNLTTRETVSSTAFFVGVGPLAGEKERERRSGSSRNKMRDERTRLWIKPPPRTPELLTVDEILLSKIFWSSKPDPDDLLLGIRFGPWAGHRFDIITAKKHQEEVVLEVRERAAKMEQGRQVLDMMPWRDITSEIVHHVGLLRDRKTNLTMEVDARRRQRSNPRLSTTSRFVGDVLSFLKRI